VTYRLKETHHRIKNSIAAVKSLLSLQAGSATGQEVKSALQEAIGRVNSIQQLYDRILITGDYHEVAANPYLEALTDSVIVLFSGTARISLVKHFDHFSLSSKSLVPMGIILNELLTNAMKYAFAGRESGQVRVSAIKRKDLITLTVHDDGIGLPTGFDYYSSRGSGLMLVDMLTQQLGGSFRIANDSGTLCTLEFNRTT